MNQKPAPRYREVRYEAKGRFVEILEFLNCGLLVSTYLAGKILRLGTHRGQLQISFLDFDHAMDLAVSFKEIAIGARRILLQASHEITRRPSCRTSS